MSGAARTLRPGGRIVSAGIQTTGPAFDMARLTAQEIELTGTLNDVNRFLGLLRDGQILGRVVVRI